MSEKAARSGLSRTLFERLQVRRRGALVGCTCEGKRKQQLWQADARLGWCLTHSFSLALFLVGPLQDLWGEAASEMLTVQYRMHAAIMDWSSQELYGGRLAAHASVAGHTMAGLPGVAAAAGLPGAAELPVLLLVDTAGCDMEEQVEEEGGDSKVGRAGAGRLGQLGQQQRGRQQCSC